MSRDDWGVKRVCLSCGTRFYDFDKAPIVCPICCAIFDPEYLFKKKTKNFSKKNDDVVEEIDTVDDDDDELMNESDDDLDGRSDDIATDDEKN